MAGGFKINPMEAGENKNLAPAPGRLFMTEPDEKGKRRLVEESDPAAAVLFAPYEGYMVDADELKALSEDSEEDADEASAETSEEDEAPEEDDKASDEAEDFGAVKKAPRGRKR